MNMNNNRSNRDIYIPESTSRSVQIKVEPISALIFVLGVFGAIILISNIVGDHSDSHKETESSGTSIIDEAELYSDYDLEQIEQILQEADDLAQDGNYKGALERISTALAVYPDSDDLQSAKDKYSTRLEQQQALSVRQDIEKDARQLAQAGDYISAIGVLDSGLLSFPDDEGLATMRDDYSDKLIEQSIHSADNAAAEHDYINAMEIIETAEGVVGENAVLATKKQTFQKQAKAQEDTAVDEIIDQIDSLVADKQYDSATDMLCEAQKKYPNNEKLKAKELPQPKNLTETLYNGNNYTIETCQMGGVTYRNAIVLNCYDNPYVLFNLDGKYETLDLTFGHVDTSANDSRCFDVYLDGECIGCFDVKADELPRSYTIDVSNVKQVKICNDGFHWVWDPEKYAIANGKLYP